MIAERVPALKSIAEDVRSGLLRRPKSLPPQLFYDATGSLLFEQITALPEYYLTRTETAIFEENAAEIVSRAMLSPVLLGERAKDDPVTVSLVELGAGTAAKTRILIRALLRQQRQVVFYPVDVSPEPLRTAAELLPREFPRLEVRPVTADYSRQLRWLREISGRKLVLYIGSSIGNFEPFSATALLARIRRGLAPGDALLLGTDMAKNPSLLLPAYDDAQGVTAAFNKNMLARINREFGGRFDLDAFRHLAVWNAARSRMEMYLESLRPQVIAIDALGLRVPFERCERIHTENSYKFTNPMVQAMLSNAGFQLESTWADARCWFTVHLARV